MPDTTLLKIYEILDVPCIKAFVDFPLTEQKFRIMNM